MPATSDAGGKGDGYITVARVHKTQGRIGEVLADLHTDFPEKFSERKNLWAWFPDGSRRELAVEDVWQHKGAMVFKFAGIDSINDAEALLGSELQIPLEERAPLEEGSYFISDLIGCKVFDDAGGGREVGSISEVRFGAGEAPILVVEGSEGREHLIPFVERFTKEMDVPGGRILMALPEGLLEISGPLNEEERRSQHWK